MLKQFSIILIIYFLGDLMQKALGLPIPGNVLGMLILFFSLYTGVIKLNMIDKISDFLLENMAFFFLPAGASLITCFALLEGKMTDILAVSLISTFIILAVTGLTVELVQRFFRRKPVKRACQIENIGNKANNNESGRNTKSVHARENRREEVI
ncbi:Antiholin-like protein LrgA [Methanosarcina sp. Kolksee]|uniref:Antiholin-like protein LrgA n=2 Tax=Methanosarcina TaxID=2207 RepID=A0A0E3LGW6_9EURY|nr:MULTISPECIES: CidA/LrgA family protein [Methanosarcina]AKB43236.1 Antiholin-like protein LrgA [Methanosarcina vacuolata Z-761]AKB46715.1 Antiholin-like protein LrgA [Methanosarcina sp. Kolksee]